MNHQPYSIAINETGIVLAYTISERLEINTVIIRPMKNKTPVKDESRTKEKYTKGTL
ncbi:MAG: hypothetical protein ABI760_02760 [Ferruginibacter sp.]